MRKSLFLPLIEENLTTLKVRYDFKTGSVRLCAAKDWEKDFDFSGYNRDFVVDGIFTDNAVYLNTEDVFSLYEKYGLSGYLNEVIDLLRAGKHFGIDAYYYEKYDIRYMMHEHSRRLGLLNKSHAIMAGGIRRHSPAEPEIDVIIDGLNLGRGMSFKNIAAGLSFGGCKATVQMDPLDVENMEIMGFLAFALDSCRDMTGPDMNFPTKMSDVMIEKGYSMQYTGGPSSKTGETGKPTAYGTYLSLLKAIEFYEGKKTVKGKSAVVMGLGAVGRYMAEHLLRGGVSQLTVADIDSEVLNEFIKQHQEYEIGICPAKDVLYLDVDILCPCAVGGIFDDDGISELKCRYIWGSANNQLKATSQEEEIRLADLIADRGIRYQVEWWHNIAGVMCGAEEYLWNGTYDTLLKKIEDVLPASTFRNLMEARDNGITPTENCYRHCEKLLYD